jgi:hypothetical protein
MFFRRNERCANPKAHPLQVKRVMMPLLTVRLPASRTAMLADVLSPANTTMLL